MTMTRSRHWKRAWIAVLFLLTSHTVLLGEAREKAPTRMMIPATINGQPARLVYDTGASDMFLFRSGAKRLGLKIEELPAALATTRSSLERMSALPNQAIIGGFDLGGNGRFYVINDIPGATADIDGVVGFGPFRRNVVVFRDVNPSVDIDTKVPPEAAHWKKLGLRDGKGVLELDVPQASGQSALVLVDSGDVGGVALSKARWDEFRAARPDQPVTLIAVSKAYGGPFVTEEMWADHLSIGTLELHGVPVSCIPESDQKQHMYDAVFGVYAILRLNLIADWSHAAAFVNPSAEPPRLYRHNKLGAVFVPADPQSDALIAHVVKGSPADRAGIQAGDVLVAIGALDVTRWKTDPRVLPLSRFFEHPAGTPIDLTVERSGKRHSIQATLEDIVSPDAGKQKK